MKTERRGRGWQVMAWTGFWLLLVGSQAAGIPGTHTAPRPWPDAVYLQEAGSQLTTTQAVVSLAVEANGAVVVATTSALLRWVDGQWQGVAGIAAPVDRVRAAGGGVWAMSREGLYRVRGARAEKVSNERILDVCDLRGTILGCTRERLFKIAEGGLDAVGSAQGPFPMQRLTVHAETLYLLGAGRLTTFAGNRFGGLDVYSGYADSAWDWGDLPARTTRDFLSFENRLLVATDRGLGQLRGMSMTAVRGEQGLPFEDLTCLTLGFTNDVWIGTSRGAMRWVDGRFHYFAGKRWLPHDWVSDVAVAGRRVWLATPAGLGIIDFEPYTLMKKAAYYERHLEEWGQKRLGFTHKLEWDDGLGEFVREVSDNDGGYTGDYLAAQAYRYAVTGDPVARQEATNTFHALRWLESMTGIPGLPARSVWARNERGHKAMHGSGGYPAEWHDVGDGKFEWKGDTSSDEICSHFYAVAVFLEVAAQGDEMRQAKQHLARIAGHILDHGWQLVDRDGKPTRWGRWDPEYFKTEEGRYDQGLQCLEILSFMKTAAVLTGEDRFAAAYRRLVDMGYPSQTLRQRQTFPPDNVLHFEDQLAFWSYWNLLRYEQDPELRSIYRRSFERTYEVVRVEQQPWFNLVYATLTGVAEDSEMRASFDHLREWPLDLRVWSFQNSHRSDLRTPPGYRALKGGVRAFSPREHEPMRWDAWTMKADGGTGGRDVVEPGGWLVAYWMARYHGYLEAPRTTDTDALSVEHSLNRQMGAKPYAGPPRPAGH